MQVLAGIVYFFQGQIVDMGKDFITGIRKTFFTSLAAPNANSLLFKCNLCLGATLVVLQSR